MGRRAWLKNLTIKKNSEYLSIIYRKNEIKMIYIKKDILFQGLVYFCHDNGDIVFSP